RVRQVGDDDVEAASLVRLDRDLQHRRARDGRHRAHVDPHHLRRPGRERRPRQDAVPRPDVEHAVRRALCERRQGETRRRGWRSPGQLSGHVHLSRSTASPPTRCLSTISGTSSAVTPAYHVPSGYTHTIGPAKHGPMHPVVVTLTSPHSGSFAPSPSIRRLYTSFPPRAPHDGLDIGGRCITHTKKGRLNVLLDALAPLRPRAIASPVHHLLVVALA